MIYHLLSQDYIDETNGCGCTYFRGPQQKCYMHDHDFFEFVITLDSNVIHECKGRKIKLDKGTLMLIRPHDVHRYTDEGQGEFCYMNLAFSAQTFNDVISFLRSPKLERDFLESEYPPLVVLPERDAESIVNKFLKLMGNAMVPEPVVYLREVLVSIMSRCFLNRGGIEENTGVDMPPWFLSLCSEMHKIENFSAGIERMSDISGMSYGYIGQSFRKYLGVTPTEYVNSIRLTYAANMLLNSNMLIIDICLECGFDNLEYFYRLFRRQYKISPAKFRKANKTKRII